METMKKIIKYIILIIAAFIFFDFLINVGLSNTYKDKKCEILSSSPEIIIKESKATKVNGYLEGTVNNNTGENINKTYVKVDLYSELDNFLGTEYITIENLNNSESIDFKLDYRYEGVKELKISTTSINEKENREVTFMDIFK